MATTILQIHDQQEAIRLANAGLLYWFDDQGVSYKYADTSDDPDDVLLKYWNVEYENYMPHIFVDEEDE